MLTNDTYVSRSTGNHVNDPQITIFSTFLNFGELEVVNEEVISDSNNMFLFYFLVFLVNEMIVCFNNHLFVPHQVHIVKCSDCQRETSCSICRWIFRFLAAFRSCQIQPHYTVFPSGLLCENTFLFAFPLKSPSKQLRLLKQKTDHNITAPQRTIIIPHEASSAVQSQSLKLPPAFIFKVRF